MDDPPPLAVERLLQDHITSVGTLELLLLLHRDGARDYGIDELCAELGSPRSWAELQLNALARGRLVALGPQGRWSYAPATAGLASAVDDLARAYEEDRHAVSRWIFKPRRRDRRGR